ncbi:Protein of unknown function [Desulfonispora thiosulfatigenes DSM 11270]|uniref:DUF2508 domain-containing protein n=1 Tax=Desulfonispora thiosulfatigenes DSM 11270 TaxID=656914 RepID=A0A1W1V115_DESTI|nr:DUF2508 family protein [Desulfonispora thiosulfatigenes]SMB87045.1 Protein of unknown function [Desulfonispora thiosulfatigenes DSM 11270]
MNKDLKMYVKKAYSFLEGKFNGLMDNKKEQQRELPLIDVVEEAKRDWEDAQNLFKEVTDPLLVEHAIHRLDAAERKYMYLLDAAGREQIINNNVPTIRA